MIVYVDLDDFKLVNDTLGHTAGDTLLRNVASHLRETLPDAMVARLGGDEFAILIEAIDADQSVAAIAETVRSCFDRTVMIDGQQADCSATLGIAIAPTDGTDGTSLMKNADLALYRAKGGWQGHVSLLRTRSRRASPAPPADGAGPASRDP